MVDYFSKCTFVAPSIAQLVERRTVELMLSSLGRWFESGSKDFFFFAVGNSILFFLFPLTDEPECLFFFNLSFFSY